MVFWYLPSIGLGMWLGSQAERIPEILRRGAPLAGVLAAVGAAVFLPNSLRDMRRIPLNTFHYQLGAWLYAAAMGFLLLWLTERLARKSGRGIDAIRFLGLNSMPIYLIHPIALYYLKQMYRGHNLTGLAISITLYTAGAIALPLLLSHIAGRLRLSGMLFGRA
jgi:peptidoglycan/LPS O-acetylase OafA/YrhL